ncbi:MAG: hypothetical protein QXQ07_04020, partial [Thermoproteota archaeon]
FKNSLNNFYWNLHNVCFKFFCVKKYGYIYLECPNDECKEYSPWNLANWFPIKHKIIVGLMALESFC